MAGFKGRDGAATITEDELDQLATRLACAILLAAFAELGITRRAFDLAAEAVLASDAFPRPADGCLLSRPAGQAGG